MTGKIVRRPREAITAVACDWGPLLETRPPGLSAKPRTALRAVIAMASWRSGYAEDCKSLYGGSIPSEASIFLLTL